MSGENHELRMKIDSTAAERGSRDFSAAVKAMANAVADLEKTSKNAFKNINKDVSSVNTSKDIINKASVQAVKDFIKAQSDLTRAMGATRSGINALSGELHSFTNYFGLAKAKADEFKQSILGVNAALGQQVRATRQASGTAYAPSVRTRSTRGSSEGGSEPRAADPLKVKQSIEQARAQVEALTVSLMKVGSFGALSQLHRDFASFQKTVAGAEVSVDRLSAAKTRFSTATAIARTSLTTMTAKVADEVRAETEAAAATRQKEAALVASASAMRKAEAQAAALTARLQKFGDTSGITALSSALDRVRGQLSNTGATTAQVRAAYGEFAEAANKSRIAVTRAGAEQAQAADHARKLADQERNAKKGALELERELRSIAGASNAASRAMRDAVGNMRGLENAFSNTYQIGSLLRTMLGSLTFGSFATSVYSAGTTLEQFSVAMQVATNSAAEAQEQISFINNMARDTGIGLRGAREDFAKFAVASNLAGVSGETTRDIFDSVSMALAVLGRGTESQKLAFLALEQMMSKGTVSSEELRRQLGEQLPGAVNMMAKALNVTTGELQDLLKAGAISSADALPKFAEEVRKAYGPGFAKATQGAAYNLGTLRNEFEFFLETVASSGLMEQLAYGFRQLTDSMRSSEFQTFASQLGQGLTDLARMATNTALYMTQNFDRVSSAIKAIAWGVAIKSVVMLGAAFAAKAQQIAAFVVNIQQAVRGNAALTTSAATAATALRAEGVAAEQAALSVGRVGKAAGVFAMIARGAGALAGPIGIAVTALTFLPEIFGRVSNSSEDTADTYSEAMTRMRTSTFSFISMAREVEGATNFEKALTNINGLIAATNEMNALRNNSSMRSDAETALSGIDPSTERTKTARSAVGNVVDKASELLKFQGSLTATRDKVFELQQAFNDAMNVSGSNQEQLRAASDALDAFGQAVVTAAASQETAAAQIGNGATASLAAARKAASDAAAAIKAIMEGDASSNVLSGSVLGAIQDGGLEERVRTLGAAAAVTGGNVVQLSEAMRADGAFSGTAEDIERIRNAITSIDMSKLRVDTGQRAELVGMQDAILSLLSSVEDYRSAQEDADAQTQQTSVAFADGENAASNLKSEVYALISALDSIPDVVVNIRASLDSTLSDLGVRTRIAGITDPRAQSIEEAVYLGEEGKAVREMKMQLEAASSKAAEIAANPNAPDGAKRAAMSTVDAIATEAANAETQIRDAVGKLFDVKESTKAQLKAERSAAKGGGGKSGGGGSKKAAKTDDDKYTEQLADRLRNLNAEAEAYALVANNEYESLEAAKLYAQSKQDVIKYEDLSTDALLRQIDAAEVLNDRLRNLAQDPVKTWMDSVPGWVEAGNTIERDVFESLSGTLSEFIQTGEFKLNDFLTSIVSSTADMMAEQSINWVLESMGRATSGGLGGLFGNMMDVTEKTATEQTSAVTSGQTIGAAMTQAGAVVAQQIGAAISSGGTALSTAGTSIGTQITNAGAVSGATMNTQVTTAGAVAGQQMGQGVAAGATVGASRLASATAGQGFLGIGAGGWLGLGLGAASIVASSMREGGISHHGGPRYASVPMAAFHNAPHYAEGTGNTSGIPAVLHDNEAVIPLSRNRKVPVEMKGGGTSGVTISFGDINVSVEGGDSSGNVDPIKIAQAIESRLSMTIDEKLATHLQYGGMLNPRGR